MNTYDIGKSLGIPEQEAHRLVIFAKDRGLIKPGEEGAAIGR